MKKHVLNIADLSLVEKHALLAELLQDEAVKPVSSQPKTYIESLGVYLPAKIVSTNQVLDNCRIKMDFPLERMTGISSRRVVNEKEFSIDLATKATVECLARSSFNPEDVDLLICCNISRYDGPKSFSFEPSTSIKLKEHFGFDKALAFDITNACTGMFTGIKIVDIFIKTGVIRCGMVVSGEYITHLTQTAQKEIDGFMDPRLACLTLGDAGAALMLAPARDEGIGFHAIDMYTLGHYSSLCIAKVTDRDHGGAIMLTDSIRSSAVAIQHAVVHAAQILEQIKWSPNAFQYLIMHQTSRTALKGAADEINRFFNDQVCHPGVVIDNLAERGNTGTTSHFIALWDQICNDRIRSGDNIAFGISGSGQTVGTALYTLDNLPDRLRQSPAKSQPLSQTKRGASRAITPSSPQYRVQIESIGTVPADDHSIKNTIGLVKTAAERCLKKSAYTRSDIGLLIHTGVYRDEFLSEPAIAAIAAGALDVNADVASPAEEKTFAFDIINSALGFLNACHVVTQLIDADEYRTVMIVTGEIENNAKLHPSRLRGIYETGSAVILDRSTDNQRGFGRFVFQYHLDHIDALTANACNPDGKAYLHFESDPNLENHYLDYIPSTVHELLQIESLDLAQIKAIFPPLISSRFVSRLSNKLDVEIDHFMIADCGDKDLFTSSIPFALQYAIERKLVEAGDVGLIISVGAGIQIGCATYYF